MKRIALVLVSLAGLVSAWGREPVGADLQRVFSETRRGRPLRCVFFGGSITQAGDGWVGDWLRRQFPMSQVFMVNSGMSATGSALGIFRIERDVIAYQPDLVAMEFCINDGGLRDEEVVRFVETMVVRLKKLPHPPAVIFLEAAAKSGANLKRHRRVARHYNLLEVDLQQAMDAHLKKTGEKWEVYFSDDVHPNDRGNSFYAETIAGALEPYLPTNAPPIAHGDASLPAPISAKPLLLDAHMAALGSVSSGWKRENFLPEWYGRFFRGALRGEEPGTALTIPVRGTTIGVLFAMDKSYGTFLASIDEAAPEHILTNTRSGYSFAMVGQDLSPGEHRLHVVLPTKMADPQTAFLNGPVKLGELLVAGEDLASSECAPVGPYPPERLARMHYEPLKPERWTWSGPYAISALTQSGAFDPADARTAIQERFVPETEPETCGWKPVPAIGGLKLDFRKITSSNSPSVVYAGTEIQEPATRDAFLAFSCDYFAKLWLNGTLIAAWDGPHGTAPEPALIPVRLQAGTNRLLVKLGAGIYGFHFSAGLWRDPVETASDSQVPTNRFRAEGTFCRNFPCDRFDIFMKQTLPGNAESPGKQIFCQAGDFSVPPAREERIEGR